MQDIDFARHSELELRLLGCQLATAEILYHLPDFPDLLQSFVWQYLDLAPGFPRLTHFLDHWTHHIEGKLHSVRLTSRQLVSPAELRYVDGVFRLH